MTDLEPWKPGDRVIVRLPDKSVTYGPRDIDVPGTVREIDLPGLPPGVAVDLDFEINGARDCYATHRELRREEGGR
jgi:hypothetical protein